MRWPRWMGLYAALVGATAHAFSGGVATTSFSSPSAGCNTCHSGGTTPTVTFHTDTFGPAVTSVSVNRAISMNLWLRVLGGQSFAGFNVSRAAGIGSLQANDPGVSTIFGNGIEVTHNARRPYSSGFAQFGFRFTPAPGAACGSTTTLRGWADSSNGNGATSGDRGATTLLNITISCLADGASCSTGTACISGSCVDGVCCNTACNAACESCAAALKSSGTGSGTCGPSSAAQLCSTAYRCSGTATSCPTSCTSSAQCAPGHACFGSLCQPQVSNGAGCTDSTQCLSGFCVDGVCCNTACTGSCEACSASLKQSGGSGTCGAARAGTACGSTYACSGFSTSCPSACVTDAQCSASAFCSGGACVPKRANGTGCARPGECASGHCSDGVCCNTACSGSCDACSVAAGGATDGTCALVSSTHPGAPSCFPYRCSGTSAVCTSSCTTNAQCNSGAFCSGGSCVGTLPTGSSCSLDAQCSSGFCTDGFCCTQRCANACDACAAALTGGADGVCSNLAAGTAVAACGAYRCGGGPSCATSCTSDGQCAAGHRCSAGSCLPLRAQAEPCADPAECLSGFCVDGLCCDAACTLGCESCAAAKGGSADGVCSVVVGPGRCAPFACQGASAACPTSCASHGDCLSTHHCSGGACLAKQADGAACNTGVQCASGFCADGRCCDMACTGQCEACDLPTVEGRCSAVTGAPRGSRPACPSDGSPCEGRCDGVQRAGCLVPDAGVVCRQASCRTDPVTRLSLAVLAATCDGQGACPPLEQQSCGAHACDGPACRGDCTDDTHCAPTHFCSAGVCAARRARGEACSAANACASGFCVDGHCCDSACSGQCEACDLTGAEGTCSAAPQGAPRGSRPACDGAGACQSSCDGVARACVVPTGSAEICNGVDDDCDGQADEGASCPQGSSCQGAAGCQATPPPPQMGCSCGSADGGLWAWLSLAAPLALRVRARRARARNGTDGGGR